LLLQLLAAVGVEAAKTPLVLRLERPKVEEPEAMLFGQRQVGSRVETLVEEARPCAPAMAVMQVSPEGPAAPVALSDPFLVAAKHSQAGEALWKSSSLLLAQSRG